MNAAHGHQHDAARAAAYSNFVHRVVGALLAAVAGLAGLQVFGLIEGSARFVWPVLLVLVVLFVPIFIVSVAGRHGISLAQVLEDPQQRQHFNLSAWILIGGAGEALRAAGMLTPAIGFAWPLALAVIGYGFLTHAQHGTSEAVAKAVRAHRLLGGTLILAGLARGIEEASGIHEGTVGLGWVVVLLAAAIQFLIYHEPEGAYAVGESAHPRHA